MMVRTLTILLIGSLLGLPSLVNAQDPVPAAEPAQRARWGVDLTTGYDATLHTYALATEDTSETISEFMVQAGLLGQSARGASHRWRVRGEASTGTELWRERIEGDYRYLDGKGVTRWRFLGRFWGRQFRDDTSFTRSSDNWEGRLEGRASPWAGDGAALDLRAWGSFIDYKTPSTLEVDFNDVGVGVFARSRGLGMTQWSGGLRRSARAYPDSSVIDRDTWSVEGDFDSHDLDGRGLRAYHKSSRRLIADETVRPSAWTHWTDLRGAVGAGAGKVILEIQSEVWDYDEESDVYFNSWRAETFAGYRWGDILAAMWQTGFTLERMDAGDSPETFTQMGLRGGVDAYGSKVGGQLILEYGRRVYDQGTVPVDEDPDGILADDTILLYSDFNYWKIWAMGNWSINRKFSVDLLAAYEPENHTERSDDASIGYASLRLVWRP